MSVRASSVCKVAQNRTFSGVHGAQPVYSAVGSGVHGYRVPRCPSLRVPMTQCYPRGPPDQKVRHSLNNLAQELTTFGPKLVRSGPGPNMSDLALALTCQILALKLTILALKLTILALKLTILALLKLQGPTKAPGPY